MGEDIAFWGMCFFFLLGLATGAWKYFLIRGAGNFKANRYVDMSHRASFFYSFACLVLLELARKSNLPDAVEAWTVSLVVVFFAMALGTYVIHGILADTDNQFARPHTLGNSVVHSGIVTLLMVALVLVELFGTLLLVAGALI